MNTLTLLVFGEEDCYMNYDDDFDRSESELKRILEGIRKLSASDLDVYGASALRICENLPTPYIAGRRRHVSFQTDPLRTMGMI
jgi:hypothetical protein